MLELEEKIKDEFSGKEEQLSGTVSIGMAEASSVNIVADVIEKFRAKFPLVKFDLYTAMADKVPESIDSGTLDIGFLLEPVNVISMILSAYAPKMRCLTVWKKYQPSNRAVSRFLEEVAMLVEHTEP